MGKLPPSIGDSNLDLVLTRYEEAMPKTRREVVAAFSSILDRGGVQKVTVEVGRPIQVVQLVDKSMAVPPAEAPSDDLWGVVRNFKMDEISIQRSESGKVLDAYQTLFYALSFLTNRKLKPQALFCHDYGQLRKWLRLPSTFPLEFLYGVETGQHLDVPEDAIVLVGISYDENPNTTTGFRVPVDILKEGT